MTNMFIEDAIKIKHTKQILKFPKLKLSKIQSLQDVNNNIIYYSHHNFITKSKDKLWKSEIKNKHLQLNRNKIKKILLKCKQEPKLKMYYDYNPFFEIETYLFELPNEKYRIALN